MKLTTALLVIQTLCLVALAVLLLRTPTPSTAQTQPVSYPAASIAAPIDEARLRRIIREEVQALATQPANGAAAIPAPALQPPRDPGADQDQRAYVEQQLAYLMSVGEASQSDLMYLEQEIAKLSPADRREMLNRLARAVNAGQIKGHL